jgi:hypothetical protein
MVDDEDDFVRKVQTIPDMHSPRTGLDLRRQIRRRLARQPKAVRRLKVRPFKVEWRRIYEQGGEEALRHYYRTQYVLGAQAMQEAFASGALVRDDAFARYKGAQPG